MLQKTAQKGFTIVELLIVIVVIGILAALVLNTFSGVQRRARDTERQTDVNSVATQLEVYYNDKGFYPTETDLSNDTWVDTNLPGMDLAALRAPGTSGNSIQPTPAANKDQYGYVLTPSTCDNTGTNLCASFILSWFKEDGGVQTKNSLN